jgi:hypothetical protein
MFGDPKNYQIWWVTAGAVCTNTSGFWCMNKGVHMYANAWQVVAWRPVRATVGEFWHTLSSMRQVSASVSKPSRQLDDTAKGQVLWGTRGDSGEVGLAWDWCEVRQVIALADPMTVLSNVQLVNDDGRRLPRAQELLYLNNAVHELCWQDEVRSAKSEMASAGS